MESEIFARIGAAIRGQRRIRQMSQPALAKRIGRNQARISELERDLIGGRMGRDRLTLFAEICDALGIVPVLVPRARADDIERMLGSEAVIASRPVQSVFDDVFVSLDDEEEGERNG